MPLSTAVFYTRPRIARSRVSDIPPNQVCLAWDATRRSRLIQDFAAIAADHPPVPGRAEPVRGPSDQALGQYSLAGRPRHAGGKRHA